MQISRSFCRRRRRLRPVGHSGDKRVTLRANADRTVFVEQRLECLRRRAREQRPEATAANGDADPFISATVERTDELLDDAGAEAPS